MMKNRKGLLYAGVLLLALFAVWTVLLQTVDVRAAGETGTEIGFAALNTRFHALTGVHMLLYTVTDWLGLVPIAVCLLFAAVGCVQMIQRKSLLKVDVDIILLGIYYIMVLLGYLVFETVPINYRPILIEERMEASYPSSTTLLVLSVMPTLAFQAERRLKHAAAKRWVGAAVWAFSLFMLLGRLVSGVHWLTDFAGAVLLSAGLFYVYKATVLLRDEDEK